MPHAEKDATRTYRFEDGYQPGVAFIGKHAVYAENRSGKSSAHVGQHETLLRVFSLLEEQGISVRRFREDGASYGHEIIKVIDRFSDTFYIRARMSQALEWAILRITEWRPIKKGDDVVYRGETTFTLFQRVVRGTKMSVCRLPLFNPVLNRETYSRNPRGSWSFNAVYFVLSSIFINKLLLMSSYTFKTLKPSCG